MKIGIDARFVGPQGTGLGKYTEKLILNLAKIDSKNDYVIFLRQNNWSYLPITKYKNFKKVLADVAWYSASEQYKLPPILNAQKLDLLHVPHFNVPIFYRGKFIVTIHDLIHHKFSETSATTKNPIIFKLKRLGYKKVIENAIYKSKKIITPSKYVKDDIIKNFKVDQAKITVTYEAAEEEYFAKSKNIASKESFILYVGNAYPHKNLSRLLDAMKDISAKLVIVSPRDVFWERLKEQIQKRNLEEKVEMKGYLEPEELSRLFAQAQAYVFPTLSEGFGIPGLNAMASGLPLVCSNIPVLKEVYGDAALYFNPDDPKDISDKVNAILKDAKIRSNLLKNASDQIKKYSWKKMAEETLRVYKEA